MTIKEMAFVAMSILSAVLAGLAIDKIFFYMTTHSSVPGVAVYGLIQIWSAALFAVVSVASSYKAFARKLTPLFKS